MLHIFPLTHKESTWIGIIYVYDAKITSALKSHPSVQYSKTHRCYYIPYDRAHYSALQSLGISITSHCSRPDIGQLHKKVGDTFVKISEHCIDVRKTTTTDQTKHLHHVDQSGTASSPIISDIASIATYPVVPSVYPSNGDSKGADIHQSIGGRSIQLSGANFYISIFYNDEDIRFLKSLKGYWQSKIRKWIVKAKPENLELLQYKYGFWDDGAYQQIKELILSAECPYLITIYRTPEVSDVVVVQITGHKSNTSIVKSITDRSYQKDEMRWTIPNDQVIIDGLIADYIRDGATVVNRLPQNDFDYHKKDETYGQYKTRFLLKTEADLKPVVERYIDTLIAFKRSKKTMTTYLGPFIKFVTHIGIDNIESVCSKDIDKYMSKISGQKVSDGYLHNAFNAIIFYYRDVLRKNEKVVNEAKRPKKDDSLPTILSLGEVDRILRALDNLKHTTILYTFYSSGIRLGEILNLRVEDMWWERDQIFVNKGKGKKDRVVPFSGILKELLKLYFDKFKPIYWLFEGQDGKLPYTERSIQHVVKKAVKMARINKKVTPHTMRHCFATHLLDGGTDVRYIQELLGHADIKTTLIYTHVTNHSLSKIQSPLDKLMLNRIDTKFIDQKLEKPESSD